MDRKPIPPEISTAVLVKSKRRCALCFYLNGDLQEKAGQIAHIDKDPSNPAEDNLAFLCLTHHSYFDSTTRQHKNYTPQEVKAARRELYASIGDGAHVASSASRLSLRSSHEKSFIEQAQSLPETKWRKAIARLQHWDVIIRPDLFVKAQFQTTTDGARFVENQAVLGNGWFGFPVVTPASSIREDKVIEAALCDTVLVDVPETVESWAQFRSGQFVFGRSVQMKPGLAGMIHHREVLRTTAHVFEFARRMAKHGILGREGVVGIALRNVAGAGLFIPDVYRSYHCKTDDAIAEAHVDIEELLGESSDLAISATLRIFEQFGWVDPPIEDLRRNIPEFPL